MKCRKISNTNFTGEDEHDGIGTFYAKLINCCIIIQSYLKFFSKTHIYSNLVNQT